MSRTYGLTAAITACVVSLAALSAFGVIGIGRGGNTHFSDVRFFYLAGSLAAAGLSPYDYPRFIAKAAEVGGGGNIGVFPYPPHTLPLWVPLSWVPLEAARWLWTTANLFILMIAAWAMGRRYDVRSSAGSRRGVSPAALFIIAIILGNPFAAHLVWTGQTGLIVLGLLLLSWHYLSRDQWFLAGIALGIAMLKPQLAVLALLWVAMAGHLLAAAVATTLVVMLLALAALQIGPDGVTQWVTSTLSYQGEVATSLQYNTNLQSLLMGLGFVVPHAATALMLAVAIAYAGALAWLYRRRALDAGDALAALLVTSLFLVQGRDYDIAVLAPLVPVLWWYARGRPATQAIALIALLVLCVPQRLVLSTGWPLLPYWRILIVGGFWLWITVELWSATRRSERVTGVAASEAPVL